MNIQSSSGLNQRQRRSQGARASDASPPRSPLSDYPDRDRQRRQTALHLQDIARAHGKAKRWTTLALPEGPLLRFSPRDLFASPFGSTAALCADEGDTVAL